MGLVIKELPWEVITFPTYSDERGSLTMAQSGDKPRSLVPFEIKRTYWLHGITDGGERGAHATFHTNQLMIPLAGGCDVMVNDGVSWRDFNLQNTPGINCVRGLWIKSGVWRELKGFAPGTVILLLSDTYYEDADYVRDWSDFLARVGQPIDGGGVPRERR